MASGITNRGRYRTLEALVWGVPPPGGGFAVFLATAAVVPTEDTNLKSELTEIAAGNGYSAGGIDIGRNSTDWPILTEDDTNDLARAFLRTVSWTASGGPLPLSGAGASYLVLTDRHATLTSREVYAWWDLGGVRTLTEGQTLPIEEVAVEGAKI